MTNIALVVLDTLRKDSFDEHFDWMPGETYDDAWSTSHWTVPAHGSLFTGLYPSEAGVHARSTDLDHDKPVLAEVLQNQGFTTHCFSANVNISGKFRFNRGFDRFDGNWRVRSMDGDIFNWGKFISKTQDEGPERFLKALWKVTMNDCDTVASLRHGAKIKLNDMGYGHETKDDGIMEFTREIHERDFSGDNFVFINLMEAHSPYAPPQEYRTVDSPLVDGLKSTIDPVNHSLDEQLVREAYENSVTYLSDRYKEIFHSLQNEHDFDLIISLGDHGELLGEYGAFEHMYGLYPELTHIPLNVWDASSHDDSSSQVRRAECVSLLDVFATVLDKVGIENDRRGQSVLGDVESGEYLTEFHGIAEARYESLLSQGYNEEVEELMCELRGVVSDGKYAHEDFDGSWVTHHETDTDLNPVMERLVNTLDERKDIESVDIDEATMNHLEDLGYA